ncbi:MAG: flippase-like domain-containing protein, partial [Acidobacteria bacterium]|nr:flippase-like domain-containing protein [Acidobacteriota bacterium]
SPTFIGFTGLALLGRPGEFARPYLIARKENLTMSSQVAVWAVERIFDIGAFAVLMSLDIFIYGDRLPFPSQLHQAGYSVMCIVLVLATGAFLVRRNSAGVADWFRRRFATTAPKFSESIAHKIQAFGDGLNTIHGPVGFLQLTGLSLLIWFLIALTYRMVMLSYHSHHLHQLHVPQVVLLMGSSMVGSLIQLPAVGGGSQLAVISMLNSDKWFAVPKEVATSCGIMLWLITFMAVIPVGLFFAHREHVSLTRITAEAAKEEETEAKIAE